jgi:hypothetical protein
MNCTRLLHTLATVKIALKQKHLYSAHQLREFRKLHRQLNRQLKQFTNPAAAARPLPQHRPSPSPFGEGRGEVQLTLI